VPDNLIGSMFSVCVGFAMMVLVLMAPPLVMTKLNMFMEAHNAARVYAVTGNAGNVASQLSADLNAAHTPLAWNGNTLFRVSQLQPGQTGPGYVLDSSPSAQSATVTFQFNAPIPFDRALTFFGGPAFSSAAAMTETASQYNELQYTGMGGS